MTNESLAEIKALWNEREGNRQRDPGAQASCGYDHELAPCVPMLVAEVEQMREFLESVARDGRTHVAFAREIRRYLGTEPCEGCDGEGKVGVATCGDCWGTGKEPARQAG